MCGISGQCQFFFGGDGMKDDSWKNESEQAKPIIAVPMQCSNWVAD